MLFSDPEDDADSQDSYDSTPVPAEPEGLPLPRFAQEITGHTAVEKQLVEMINAGKLPHAMIFSGLQGIGKSGIAFRLAKFLLSRKPVDDGPSLFGAPEPSIVDSLGTSPEDSAVKLILSGGHPDLSVIERKFEEEKNRYKDIDVEQVREIPGFLHMTPFMGGWRIVIVDDADTMTRSSQNAILKILEEPPKNSLLILIAHRPGLLIPTIRSRSRVFEFSTPGRSDFDALMKKAMPTASARDLDAVHNISSGSIGMSLRLLQDGALKSLGQITALLMQWPDLSWRDIHLAGEVLGGKGQDDTGLQGFQDILMWICESITKARATGSMILPEPLNVDPFIRLAGDYNLEKWSSVCEELRTHFNTVKYGSLDRRQAVFGAFSILKAGD